MAGEDPRGVIRSLSFDPFDYFATGCQRCHGPGGSFYGENFGKDHTREELHEIVREMAAGPAQSPLSGDSLRGLVAYHYSLITDTPYIQVTGVSSDTLRGVVTPGAEVQLLISDTLLYAQTESHYWSAGVDSGLSRPARVEIRAVAGGDTTMLFARKSAFSHHSFIE